MPPDTQTPQPEPRVPQPQPQPIPPAHEEKDKPNGFVADADHAWINALPDEALRVEPTLQMYKGKDFNEVGPVLAKAIVSTKQLLGRDKIPIPKSDEEYEGAFKALGRPESPDKYDLPKPELPEGVPYDEAGEKQFRQWAFKGGVPAAKARELWKEIVASRLDGIKQGQTEWAAKIAESNSALRQELGQAYEPFIAAADQALKQYGGDDAFQILMAAGIAHHPAIVRAWGNVGRELAGIGKLKDVEKVEALTPGQWDVRIRDFREDYKDALYDNRHPDHRTRVEQLTKLYEAKHQE